jgi:hypothetical protein
VDKENDKRNAEADSKEVFHAERVMDRVLEHLLGRADMLKGNA